MSSRTPTDTARAAESNLGWILGVRAGIHGLALLFVGLRIYTRLAIVRSFGKDDALILISAACALGGMATYIFAAFYGLGRHADTIPKEDYQEYLKTTFIDAFVSTIGALACLKTAIGFALLRLSDSRRYSQVIWGMIGFVWLYAATTCTEWLLHCAPIASFWDSSLRATCLPSALHHGFALMTTACNLATDIAFATLPIPLVLGHRREEMAHRARVYLIGILALGYIAVLLGVAKVVCQYVFFRGDPDSSFVDWVQLFGFIQVNVGIVAACAPSLNPLVGGVLRLNDTITSAPSRYGAGNPSFRYSYGAGGGRQQHSSSASRRESRMVTISGGPGVGGGGRGSSSRKGWLKSKDGTGEFEMNSDMFGMLRVRTRTPDARAKTASPAGSEDIMWRGGAESVAGGSSVGIIRTVNFSVSSIN